MDKLNVEHLEELKKKLSAEMPHSMFIKSGVAEYINKMIYDLQNCDYQDKFINVGEKIKSFTNELCNKSSDTTTNTLGKLFGSNSNQVTEEQKEKSIKSNWFENQQVNNNYKPKTTQLEKSEFVSGSIESAVDLILDLVKDPNTERVESITVEPISNTPVKYFVKAFIRRKV